MSSRKRTRSSQRPHGQSTGATQKPTPQVDTVEADSYEQPSIHELAELPDDDIVADMDPSPADDDLDSEDSLTFSNGVIEKIVSIACKDVPGVVGMKGGFINRVQETITGTSPTKGVSVEVMQDNSVRVNISILMEYGAFAPKVFEDVKRAVVKELSAMTGLEVSGVNLRIEDVVIPGEDVEEDDDEAEEA